MSDLLKINEIFYSIQGESSLVGKPTLFIRTAMCNLRCYYCDTKYAFWEATLMSVEDILQKVKEYPTRYVCVTGGEPLGQKQTLSLLNALIKQGYQVSIETSGSFLINEVPKDVIRIIDIKCPSSGEEKSFKMENLNFISDKDEIKFVIGSKADFEWAKNFIMQNQLNERATLLFSPVFNVLSEKELANWILKENLSFVTLQLQLHKYIWHEKRGV